MKKIKVLFMALVLIFAFGLTANATHKGVININTATVEQLSQLVTGEVAKNIVDYRSVNGPFASLNDLIKVKGITRTMLDDLRPFLAVSGETTFRIDEMEKSGGHPQPMEESK